MASQPAQQAAAEQEQRTPVGILNVVGGPQPAELVVHHLEHDERAGPHRRAGTHSRFAGHATTFELTKTEVGEKHRSRRGESDGGSCEESLGVTDRIKRGVERLTGGREGSGEK